jgi:hypothetical protein
MVSMTLPSLEMSCVPALRYRHLAADGVDRAVALLRIVGVVEQRIDAWLPSRSRMRKTCPFSMR